MMIEDYVCPGNLYFEGRAYNHHFSQGCIETIDGKVVGGDVVYKDGDSHIEVYVYRGNLSIFRPSTQLYSSRGYATTRALRAYHKPYTLDRIKQILNKNYKDNPLVGEFMELARSIFYSRDLRKEFNYRGEYIL